MRINQYIARATGLSRRAADAAIAQGRVALNGRTTAVGTDVATTDAVTLDGQPITISSQTMTIMLNKPVGYVVSRHGQGNKTVYDLLPDEYRQLKPVGRLDKDSSGLLLLTNDGNLANELTHPRHAKTKIYEVVLDKSLTSVDKAKIEAGVQLEDGLSLLTVIPTKAEESKNPEQISRQSRDDKAWIVKMSEGRSRQIRRTFAALGFEVTKLHRTHFGSFQLHDLPVGQHKVL